MLLPPNVRSSIVLGSSVGLSDPLAIWTALDRLYEGPSIIARNLLDAIPSLTLPFIIETNSTVSHAAISLLGRLLFGYDLSLNVQDTQNRGYFSKLGTFVLLGDDVGGPDWLDHLLVHEAIHRVYGLPDGPFWSSINYNKLLTDKLTIADLEGPTVALTSQYLQQVGSPFQE
ncbi:MAG: hypothetical protein ACKVP7_16160 [Hyphomicrobiaceae bacterium]